MIFHFINVFDIKIKTRNSLFLNGKEVFDNLINDVSILTINLLLNWVMKHDNSTRTITKEKRKVIN